MHQPKTFDTFFMGGFECSTHRRSDGRRLDLLASTQHDRFVVDDYKTLREHGLRSLRDGLRWHLIETKPGVYDWSSFLPMLRAANAGGMQVIWDLCHYGWPDDLEIWRPAFVDRFAQFAGAAARLVREEGGPAPLYCPINEISFWAWAGGDNARFWPLARRRGGELKRQLARAAIAGIAAIREADPRARIAFADPVINVTSSAVSGRRHDRAEELRLGQYEAWDMILGRNEPGLGGEDRCMDLIGINYYSNNQWTLRGDTIYRDNARYRPFSDLLREVHARYKRPLFVAETGAEGDERASWLSYICDEVFAALQAGLPIEGLCLYPVLDYPGWANNRHCETGLLGFADEHGHRPLHAGLAAEVARQQARLMQWLQSSQRAATSEPTSAKTLEPAA